MWLPEQDHAVAVGAVASDAVGDELLEALGVFDNEVAAAGDVGAENWRRAELANDGHPAVADDAERVRLQRGAFLLAKVSVKPAAVGLMADVVDFGRALGPVIEGVVVSQIGVVSVVFVLAGVVQGSVRVVRTAVGGSDADFKAQAGTAGDLAQFLAFSWQ